MAGAKNASSTDGTQPHSGQSVYRDFSLTETHRLTTTSVTLYISACRVLMR